MTETIDYRYDIKFPDGRHRSYNVKLDSATLDLVEPKGRIFPEWAQLENFRCENCTLAAPDSDYCPVAVGLESVIEDFKDSISYESVDIYIASNQRDFTKTTSLQEALNSLMGLVMVTSGCPVLGKLKPMVRIHQPFSTLYERKYRAVTMYLLAQYFISQKGGEPDWKFEGLIEIFDEIRKVNLNFCRRLAELKVKDAAVNALIALDSFANYTSIMLNDNMLGMLEASYNEYFKELKDTRSKKYDQDS